MSFLDNEATYERRPNKVVIPPEYAEYKGEAPEGEEDDPSSLPIEVLPDGTCDAAGRNLAALPTEQLKDKLVNVRFLNCSENRITYVAPRTAPRRLLARPRGAIFAHVTASTALC